MLRDVHRLFIDHPGLWPQFYDQATEPPNAWVDTTPRRSMVAAVPVGNPGQLVRVTARRAAVARETVAETLVGLADRLDLGYHGPGRATQRY